MVDQVKEVTAWAGFKGKLFATKAEADKSMLEEPYRRSKDKLFSQYTHLRGPCAYSEEMAINNLVGNGTMREYLEAYEALYGPN